VVVALVAACGSPGPGTPAVPATPGEAASSGASGPPATAEPGASGETATPTATDEEPAGALDEETIGLGLEPVLGGLDSPIGVTHAGDGSGRLFVVEQAGRIRVVRDGALEVTPFLDIRDRISSGGERGLLGLAFHPDFRENGRLFVDYTDLDGDTVVAEYTLSLDGDAADPGSERVLLHIDQPYPNHNGGALAFGPDGYLYVAMGDGGSGGDPEENGERLDTLLGKILRISVDPDGDRPYGIPDDNPYLATEGAEPEIAFTGLRNPWRITFDRETGDLWIGDVGQNRIEEVDVARAGRLGLDFGWDRFEGRSCFEPSSGCDPAGFAMPIAEYDHDHGCSVTGGYVYRGAEQPALEGVYVFADVCSGLVFGVRATGPDEQPATVLLESESRIASFGEDEAGELYAVDLASGELLRVIATG
jgi:glucose/arabinose dehydrogenase